MKIAALDLGTNTFLCLLAEGSPEGGITKVHKDLMKVVRLGQEIQKTGSFHVDALKRARVCLEEFKSEIDLFAPDKILAMATSASRDAKNGQELFRIGEELGIPIEIIKGADEARITYQGAMAFDTNQNRSTLVVDVGGGSTELILGVGKNLLFSQSVDLGGVRLTEKFVTSQPISTNEQNNLQKYILTTLESSVNQLKKQKIDSVVAVAGTPTSIAAIEVGKFDEEKVEGYKLTQESLRKWTQEFANTSVEDKKNKYLLGGRADIIYAGSSILLNILESLNISEMTVSTKGVRYGVALEMLK